MLKKCEECGLEFEARTTKARFCSRQCFQKFLSKNITMTSRLKAEEERIEIELTTAGDLTLAILADVHNNFEYLRWAVDEILKHPDWRVIINGDLWDADQYSNHPTLNVTSLADAVQESIKILAPIFSQIIAFVWGNHEERCFRLPSGKGTMPSYFDLFFQAWQAVNPKAIICEPMKSLLVSINGKWRMLVKHGKSAGKNFGVMEWRDVLTTNEDIDVFVLSHGHVPDWMIVKRPTIEDPREIHLVRTTAGVSFLPYQDKANLFISPIGLTRIIFNSTKIKVEPR